MDTDPDAESLALPKKTVRRPRDLDAELTKLKVRNRLLEVELQQTAEKLVITQRALEKKFRDAGLPLPDVDWDRRDYGKGGRKAKLTPHVLIEAHHMHHRLGMTSPEIARGLGVDASVLRYFLLGKYWSAAAQEAYRVLGVSPPDGDKGAVATPTRPADARAKGRKPG